MFENNAPTQTHVKNDSLINEAQVKNAYYLVLSKTVSLDCNDNHERFKCKKTWTSLACE